MMGLGGTGVISVATHVAGPRLSEMIDAQAAGDHTRALRIHLELMPLFKALFMTANPIMVKKALELQGFGVGGVRLPLVDPTAEQTAELERIMRQSGSCPDPASALALAKGARRYHMTKNTNRLRVIPLGGLDEIGKNMTVLEFGNDMIVIDAGIMFPDDDHPGIDLILPDYSYIVKRKDKLRGIVITHGHEDHTARCRTCSRTWAAGSGARHEAHARHHQGQARGTPHQEAETARDQERGTLNLGLFGLDFFAVNHSIPDGVGIYMRTPVGNVLHTGDFKLDQTPIDGRLTDFAALRKSGKQGVMLLMRDSTDAETRGTTRRGRGRQGAAHDLRRRRAARHRRLVREPHPSRPAGL